MFYCITRIETKNACLLSFNSQKNVRNLGIGLLPITAMLEEKRESQNKSKKKYKRKHITYTSSVAHERPN